MMLVNDLDLKLTRFINRLIKNKEPLKAADTQLDEYKTKASFYYSTNYF